MFKTVTAQLPGLQRLFALGPHHSVILRSLFRDFIVFYAPLAQVLQPIAQVMLACCAADYRNWAVLAAPKLRKRCKRPVT